MARHDTDRIGGPPGNSKAKKVVSSGPTAPGRKWVVWWCGDGTVVWWRCGGGAVIQRYGITGQILFARSRRRASLRSSSRSRFVVDARTTADVEDRVARSEVERRQRPLAFRAITAEEG